MFYQRLDFIMRLTKTSNTTLGNVVSLVPSYISKLRSGSRPLPRNPVFLDAASQHFAKRLSTPEREAVFRRAINMSAPLPEQLEKRAALVRQWLLTGSVNGCHSVDASLISLWADGTQAAKPVHYAPETMQFRYYFDLDGKREAVLQLLTDVLSANVPQTLYLYSDDSLEWLIGDQAFLATWTSLMQRVLNSGCTLTTIHSSKRSAGESFIVLSAWLPLYLTGCVQVYYYPRLRDELFYHTLFIAPQSGAILSLTTDDEKTDSVCTYHRNARVLRNFSSDFERFISKCRPLFNEYTSHQASDFWEKIEMISLNDSSIAAYSPAPTAIGLPSRVIQAASQRAALRLPDSFSQFDVRLRHNLQLFQVYDHFPLPDLEQAVAGEVPFPLREMLGNDQLTYTRNELLQHLKHISYLLENFENYHCFLSPPATVSPLVQDYALFAKSGVSNIFSLNGLWLIQSERITSSCWDLLAAMRGAAKSENRAETIHRLRDYIQRLAQGAQ